MASRAAGFVSVAVLALHLVAGTAAIVMLPGGFAFDDIHLWSNRIVPAISMLAVVVALVVCVWRRSTAVVRLVVAAAAGGWLAAVVTGLVLFPMSITLSRVAVPALIALSLLALAWSANERDTRSLAALVVGAVFGVVVIAAQRAPLPSTRPSGGTLADVRGEPSDGSDVVAVPCGKHELRVRPLLTFTSRSPDRTWTVLADGHGSRRAQTRYAPTATGFAAAFTDDGDSTLVVDGEHIEAITTLREPVYSHLNAFTTIDVPFDATLSFGPTGSQRFPIEPADYPSGRPTKLAYMDADGFHVVRASDAEKGPFTELASGRLARGEPLILELRPRDDSDAGCRLIFEDWSSQVSTEPSPTAGWGVPQGSVQFFSNFVVLALANTGPGRGFDSVGHAAGTYRNRLRIEAIR